MIAGLALVAALLAPADRFAHSTLAPAGHPRPALSEDLDGDRIGDLLFVDGRHASVFFGSPSGFPPAPDLVFDLPKDAAFVDIADLESDGPRELCLLGPQGVSSISFVGRKVHEPVAVDGLGIDDPLFGAVPDSDVMWNDFILDIDGVGAEDAVLPTGSGYRVALRTTASGFHPGGVVPVSATGDVDFASDSDLREIRQTLVLPRLFAGDVVGDSARELLTFDGRDVCVYSRPTDGGLWRESFRRVLYTGDASFAEGLFSSRNVRVADLDGSGKSDVIVVQAERGEIDFFRTPSGDGAEPLSDRRVLRLDGFLLPPKLIDLDADGRIDLLAAVTDRISALSAMKVFLSRTFTMRYAIFKNREPARFARTPDAMREIRFPLEYTTGGNRPRVDSQMTYTFDADVDGDGIKDLVLKTSATELTVYRGEKGGTFAGEAAETIAIDDATPFATVQADPYDWNHDGKADFLLTYGARDGGATRYVTLMSTRP